MDKTRYIMAGSFIDGSGTEIRRNVFLAIKDSIIEAIGSATDLPGNAKTAIDDFSHCTIVPALVDCSVFLSRSPSVSNKVQLPSIESTLLERHIQYCHAHGVLGVASSDNLTDITRFQKQTTQGKLINIRTSGNTAGDFLKINYSGDIDDNEASVPKLNHKNLCRIIQQKGERKAVVVANGPKQVKEALESGCEAIEQGYAMGEDNLKEMADKNVLWIPNVVRAKNGLDGSSSGGDVCCRFSQRYVAPGKHNPGAEAFWKKMLAQQLNHLRVARELGVTTAIGTGAGTTGIIHGESMVEEMKLFIKAGYSLTETIRCASNNGARFFGMENLGALTTGRKTTFLITRGTPQQLPRKLSYLEGIYVDGVPSKAYSKNPF